MTWKIPLFILLIKDMLQRIRSRGFNHMGTVGQVPSRPRFLEVYTGSGLVLLTMELGHTVRYLAPLPYNLAHTLQSVLRWLVCLRQCPQEGAVLMWLLPGSCSFCVAGVFQMLLKTWVLSSFPHTGSNRKIALWASPHPPTRPVIISLIFSFFSPHTCSRGSTTWKVEA